MSQGATRVQDEASGDAGTATLETKEEAPRESARERILRESAVLFATQGYHATGISEISKATNLTRGALYYHIDGKESLLYEICKTQIERVIPAAEEIVARDASAVDRLHMLARALLRNIVDDTNEWAVFFAEFRSLTPVHREEVIAARDQYESFWVRLLEQGAMSGELRGLPPILSKGILGMFNYTYVWLRPDGPYTPEQIADWFLDLLLDGLRPRR